MIRLPEEILNAYPSPDTPFSIPGATHLSLNPELLYRSRGINYYALLVLGRTSFTIGTYPVVVAAAEAVRTGELLLSLNTIRRRRRPLFILYFYHRYNCKSVDTATVGAHCRVPYPTAKVLSNYQLYI